MNTKSSLNSWIGNERRQWPRRPCAIEAELSAGEDSSGFKVRITDISLGGCYVEMISPLPRGSNVKISMPIENQVVQIVGKVRSAHEGFGMGIGFTNMGARDFQAIEKFVPATKETSALFEELTGLPQAKLSSEANGKPRPNQPPRESKPEAVSQQEVLSAMIRLLARKGVLTREEIAAEIDAMRR